MDLKPILKSNKNGFQRENVNKNDRKSFSNHYLQPEVLSLS